MSHARLRVQLFSTPGSRNEYYGEWVVSELQLNGDRWELTLLRLHRQAGAVAPRRGTQHRSRNEREHDGVLRRLFPGWLVKHEPETILDIHEPSVRGGVSRDICDGMSRSYTCDFVLCKGTARLCIESKPVADHLTPEALAKCRVLRDSTLARVVVMVGSGDSSIAWYDLGPPEQCGAGEAWYGDFDELARALGVCRD